MKRILFTASCLLTLLLISCSSEQLIDQTLDQQLDPYDLQIKEILDEAEILLSKSNSAQEMYDSFMSTKLPDIVAESYVREEDMGIRTTDGRVFIWDFKEDEDINDDIKHTDKTSSNISRDTNQSINSDRNVLLFWGFGAGAQKAAFMGILSKYSNSNIGFKTQYYDLTIDNLKRYMTSAGTVIIAAHGYHILKSHWTRTLDTVNIDNMFNFPESTKYHGGDGSIGYARSKTKKEWNLMVSDKFFESCEGSFPDNSIMLMASCEALAENDNRWNVLKNKNLGGLYGYDDVHHIGDEYADFDDITRMMLEGHNIGETILLSRTIWPFRELSFLNYRGDRNIAYVEKDYGSVAITMSVECDAGKYNLHIDPAPSTMRYNDNGEMKTSNGLFLFTAGGKHDITVYYPNLDTPEDFEGEQYNDRSYFLDDIYGTLAPYIKNIDLLNCKYLAVHNNPTSSTLGLRNLKSLKSISANNLLKIGIEAFKDCASLQVVNIPNCIFIDNNAFQNCQNIESIDIPKCNIIGNSAFQNCTALKNVSATNCTTLGTYSFSECKNLQSAQFPTVNTIGDRSFNKCFLLKNIDISEVREIGAIAFNNCFALQSLTLSYVETLGEYAFHQSGLSDISLPSVVTIGHYAFLSCENLKTVHFSDQLRKVIGGFHDLFNGCGKLETVYIPSEKIEMESSPVYVATLELATCDRWVYPYTLQYGISYTKYYVKASMYDKFWPKSREQSHMFDKKKCVHSENDIQIVIPY